jgi:hypothetical protein
MVLLQSMTIVSAETPYDSMIRAINRWYESNPKPSFKSADSQRVFGWRVSLEQFDYDTRVERFLFYEKLLAEIGEQQFTHNSYNYNANSIRAKMLKDYPFSQYTETMVGPATNFGNIYEWFQSNITNRKEHLYWLRLFLGYPYSMRDRDKDVLVANHSESLNNICLQYIALLSASNLSSSEILNIDQVYEDSFIFMSTGDNVDSLLRPLSIFIAEVGYVLTEDSREAVISFLVPDYVDNDYAIKIYAVLTK